VDKQWRQKIKFKGHTILYYSICLCNEWHNIQLIHGTCSRGCRSKVGQNLLIVRKDFFFAMALRPNERHGLLILEASRSHTTTHHSWYYSSGWVISSSLTPLPDNTQQTSMPPVGFEHPISAGEQPQTYALDRAATGTGRKDS
jgi:hypothetical protein